MSNKYLSKVGEFIVKVGGWKVVTAFIIAFVIGLWAGSAAASGTLSYTRPITRADGSPLAATEVASYTINCTYTPTGGVAAACASQAPTSFAGTALGGTVTFVVSASGQACFTLRTVDTAGQQSAASNQACKAVTIAVPNPPTNVVVAFNVTINGQTVSIDPVPAFGVLSNGKRSTTVYGFVRAGTPCIGAPVFTYRNRTYYRVARADVGWWGTAANDNAAAPCSGA
jgi:hypothetical protein